MLPFAQLFLRTLLEQPVWNEAEWAEKAETFEIRFREAIPYLPVVAMPERTVELEGRFGGAHNMQFVVDNALQELIRTKGSVLLTLDEKRFILLFPFPRTLKRNVFDDIRQDLQQVQLSMHRHMRLGLSFYIGEACDSMAGFKKQIQDLLDVKTFRFYAGERCITKVNALNTARDDIFVHYAEALQDLRDCILSKSQTDALATSAKWMSHIEAMRYPIDAVRSWVLNMATELELKYTVMQNFVTNFNAGLLHRTIYSIDTLDHLKEWLNTFIEQKSVAIQTIRDQTVRKEISEAKRFIMMNLSEKISMEDMANRLNFNPTHFSRVFKNETGETFVEFVTRTKMERARELLNQSDLTVQQIAVQLGFEHTSYFIKLFRSFSGMSPVEYRRTI